MKLRTEIEITPFSSHIEYADRIFTIGSCFAQSIGGELVRSKFRAVVNPTGTLFNPISICNTIERLAQRRHITIEELREGDMGWYHYDFHSSLNAPTAEQTLGRINGAIDAGHRALVESRWVIITLGTAWIYEREEGGVVVANCHKEPSRNFRRRRVEVADIVERLDTLCNGVLAEKSIILTLSPVRHVADGLAENSLSKATLRMAIDEVVARAPRSRFYLPAYEILLDDLRDYRFYGDDLVHPSPMAVEYIWRYFCDSALSSSARELLPKVEKIVRAANHRPTNPSGELHTKLCLSQLEAIKRLEGVDLEKEYNYFEGQLKNNL